MPKVSLVVSTLGRTRELDRLLGSLALQTFRDFETIIVDQNTDGRLAPVLAAADPSLTITHAASPRGLSRGRNKGIALARGDILAFPDDDCWYPERLLADVVALFGEHHAIDLFSGKTVDAGLANSLSAFDADGHDIGRGNVWRSGNSNTIFVRTLLAKDVLFDESLGVGADTIFQSGEETDFLLRLLQSGARMRYEPKILVHHDQVDLRAKEGGLQRARNYAPGLGRVLRVHRYGADQVLWFTLRPLARACLAALAGDIALAHYKMAWAKGLTAGYLAPVSPHRDAARAAQS